MLSWSSHALDIDPSETFALKIPLEKETTYVTSWSTTCNNTHTLLNIATTSEGVRQDVLPKHSVRDVQTTMSFETKACEFIVFQWVNTSFLLHTSVAYAIHVEPQLDLPDVNEDATFGSQDLILHQLASLEGQLSDAIKRIRYLEENRLRVLDDAVASLTLQVQQSKKFTTKTRIH